MERGITQEEGRGVSAKLGLNWVDEVGAYSLAFGVGTNRKATWEILTTKIDYTIIMFRHTLCLGKVKLL